MKVYSTVAHNAEAEISEIISHRNRVYKSWQLSNHKSENIRLCTTLDEVKLLWKEPVCIRPGFDADDDLVAIPNFFTKISYNSNEFLSSFKVFCESNPNKGLVYESIEHFEGKLEKRINRTKIEEILDENGLIDTEKFLVSELNPVKYMRLEYQKSIAEKINRILSSYKEFLLNSAVFDAFRCIHILLNLDEKWYELYHHFDYQYINPKILILDDVKEVPKNECAIKLLYLVLLGFDIFIVSPSGYTNIENILHKELYDLHYENEYSEIEVEEPVKSYVEPKIQSGIKSKKDKIIKVIAIVSIIYLMLLFTKF